MERVLRTILTEASSHDREVQNNAVRQLAFIFERSKFQINLGSEQLYLYSLSPEMLLLHLDHAQQEELLVEFCKLIRSDARTPGMFWAMSKAFPTIIYTKMIIELFNERLPLIDENMFSQAIVALENCMYLARSEPASEVAKLLDAFNPLRFLQEQIRHTNPKIADLSRLLLDQWA